MFQSIYIRLEASRTGTAMTAGAKSAGSHGRTVAFSAEQIQTIDEMHHTVTVDGIVLCILTHGRRNGTADIALLAQDIIELHTDRRRVTLQEILGNLRVPKQLVAVHAGIRISAA